MNSGKLRHPVDVQRVVETRDAAGGVIRNWATIDTVWASVRPLQGREYLEAQQVNANISHKVMMRYYDELNPTYRLRHDGRTLNIISIADADERNQEHVITCAEELD